ncbi:MAG: SET domain-containing protein-lysine N-methyltransferase [Acidobacteriota bacterium]|nr:SET domain-containing protein-lysine N-methyltransferase [Acidobacteriota bacterium]
MLTPPNVYVKDTGTAKGRGVFASRAFRKGEIVEISPVVLFQMQYNSLPKVVKTLVFDWEMLAGKDRNHALALGYGSFYNHNNPANMRYEADSENNLLRFIAVRDIDVDEELTINYSAEGGAPISNEENDNNWFEDHKVKPIID